MSQKVRCVFDCNILLQAMASGHGPAARCVQLCFAGTVQLFITRSILEELAEVSSRPKLIAKLHLIPERVHTLMDAIEASATVVDDGPPVFVYPRDPDDAKYVNLAIAVEARLIVSRDRDLPDLMNPDDPQGQTLLTRFPLLRIITPPAFLAEFDAPAR